MFISLFDLFRIGVGPSSSHTMGPMIAAARFLQELHRLDISQPMRVQVSLHGSLAFTGKGHATDRAIMLGLLGFEPATLDPDDAEKQLEILKTKKQIHVDGLPHLHFDPDEDLIFDYGPPLEGHPNGMIFSASDPTGNTMGTPHLKKIYYSIGGGFVREENEHCSEQINGSTDLSMPYPFKNAVEMLQMANESGLSIAEMKKQNELQNKKSEHIQKNIQYIWSVMNDCIERGLSRNGTLPGKLNVQRRAQAIITQLKDEQLKNSQTPHTCTEWLSVYAMAVNEENAAGGQIVSAPTNGAAGVIPAVLRYYLDFVPGASEQDIETFLLTASAIGSIIKHNASISGAEVGCQGEVGSASAMAAAGLCAVQGGTPMQIENAAEIALEHHLGMTCDPVAGLVQVPCIERNGLGAVKAVTASALALRGDGKHIIPLDACIETMRQTGLDMSDRYKETSQGGLAVNVAEC